MGSVVGGGDASGLGVEEVDGSRRATIDGDDEEEVAPDNASDDEDDADDDDDADDEKEEEEYDRIASHRRAREILLIIAPWCWGGVR